jgi:broad specificity phosphatase PhoE
LTPFPNGESYIQTTERVKDFLKYLLDNYDGKTIMVIGHRATQYGLEHLINHIPLETIISAS